MKLCSNYPSKAFRLKCIVVSLEDLYWTLTSSSRMSFVIGMSIITFCLLTLIEIASWEISQLCSNGIKSDLREEGGEQTERQSQQKDFLLWACLVPAAPPARPPVMQRSSTAWRMWCIVSLIFSLLSWLFSPPSCSLAHCSSGLKRHVPREGRSSSFALIISLIPCFFSPQAPDRDLLNLCDISFSRLWHHHLFSSDVMVNKCGCLRVGIF